MLLNTSAVCDCGAEKSPRVQWCDGCWSALRSSHRITYISARARLEAVMQEIGYDLGCRKDGKEAEDQPCW